MRLPIYRQLGKRVEILGLSPFELGGVALLFLLLNQIFSQVRFASAFILLFCVVLGAALRSLNQKYNERYFERLIRFISLPDEMPRELEIREKT